MIIDTHVHVGNMIGFNMTEEMIIHMMDKYGIDYCIVSNGDAVEYGHDLKPIPKEFQVSQSDAFMRTINFARKYPGRIGIMPWIKPATESADETLDKMIKDNSDIVKGIKVHPYHSKTFFDAECMEGYFELARKYSLPVVSHTGGCEEAAPVHVYNMAKKYADVNFVMVHMGLGTDNQEAVDLMAKADNLYADTTWVPMSTSVEVINRYGSSRIVFGSDSPIDGIDTYDHNPKGDKSLYHDYFYKIEEIIGKEAYENLMYKNAKRLFNI